MRLLLLSSALFFAAAGNSQGTVNVDNGSATSVRNAFMHMSGGYPVPSTKYVSVVSGSPFYYDKFLLARLVLSSGSISDSQKVKLDLLDNTVQYLSSEGTELIASTPIRSIHFYEAPATNTEYVFSDYMPGTVPEKGWYIALVHGNAVLYKRIAKRISESKAYGSSVTEQTINNADQMYLFQNGTYTRIKKLKELPELLSTKKTELDAFISSNRLSGKSDADFVALVNEYNRLIQQ